MADELRHRRVLVEFSLQGFGGLMQALSVPGQMVHVVDWPKDAEVVAAHVDPVRQRVLFTIESATYEPVPPGALYRILTPLLSIARVSEVLAPEDAPDEARA